ncbi:MAG: AMP-binding protein [Deltaproteobacteria bacterium]|nr:AMP-binding protein [Deltaproteobacteria bacterium]
MQLWNAIEHWSSVSPDRESILPFTYRALKESILRVVKHLPHVLEKRVGLFMTNSPLWGIYDIALMLKGAVVVPLPVFFSQEQIRHIISDANLDILIIEPCLINRLEGSFPLKINPTIISSQSLEVLLKDGSDVQVSELKVSGDRLVKIIYTSGTTGSPKGVMIRLKAIESVTNSLILRTKADSNDRHLSLLPLSTLLEAIGGLYLPLTVGASIVYPLGYNPNNLVHLPENIIRLISDFNPTSLIVVPFILDAVIKGLERFKYFTRKFHNLRFVACGGAPLSNVLIEKSKEIGIPLYQGYGLSECTSVVSLNGEGINRAGSVGMPLEHARVEIAKDGEILVSGDGLMAGYTNEPVNAILLSWATGDMGYMDNEGYLYITGRKDNIFVLSNGRNISPEWIEAELAASKAITQVMVYGDGKPYPSALIVPNPLWLKYALVRLDINTRGNKMLNHPLILEEMLKEIHAVSSNLPEYAHVKSIAVINEPWTAEKGTATQDGRLKRKEIMETYKGKEVLQ